MQKKKTLKGATTQILSFKIFVFYILVKQSFVFQSHAEIANLKCKKKEEEEKKKRALLKVLPCYSKKVGLSEQKAFNYCWYVHVMQMNASQ